MDPEETLDISDFIKQSQGIGGDEDGLTKPGQHCTVWVTVQAPPLTDVAITD